MDFTQTDGSFGAPQQLVNNLSGPVTNVRSNGTLTVVDSGAASGRTLTLYNGSGQSLGSLNFTYPTQNWEHSVGMSLLVPLNNNAQRIYFIVGSQFDQQKTTLQVTTSGLFNATLNPDSVYYVDVSLNGNSVQALGAPHQIATGLRNSFGLTLDSAGNLIIGDNGQDGPHVVNQTRSGYPEPGTASLITLAIIAFLLLHRSLFLKEVLRAVRYFYSK